jgi:hypothetical protein
MFLSHCSLHLSTETELLFAKLVHSNAGAKTRSWFADQVCGRMGTGQSDSRNP